MRMHIMMTNGLTMTVLNFWKHIHTKGVCGIVNNAVDLETAKPLLNMPKKYDFMYAAVGFHPENLENIPDNYLEQLAQLSKHKRLSQSAKQGLIIIGTFRKTCKKRVLRNRSGFLLTLKCQLIVHDREAHGDVYDLLRKYKPNALVHCFLAVLSLCVKWFAWECTSASAVLLHSKCRRLEVASKFRLTGFCLKPTLRIWRPKPFRGKRCDSSMIIYAAEKSHLCVIIKHFRTSANHLRQRKTILQYWWLIQKTRSESRLENPTVFFFVWLYATHKITRFVPTFTKFIFNMYMNDYFI